MCMMVNDLIAELRKVCYNARYKFVCILSSEELYISSLYTTDTSFIIELGLHEQYSLDRFRNILYIQKNNPIIVKLSIRDNGGELGVVEYDGYSNELVLYFN